MSATTSATRAWKNFPRYVMLAMSLVVTVNARFIYIAVQTFPGAATNDDFDTSNRYDAILRLAQAQDALRWTENVQVQSGAPVMDLSGPDRHALHGAHVTAQARRPLGPNMQTPLAFNEATPGHYVAGTTLPLPGQWDVMLNIDQGGHTVHVTRRVLVSN
jgi:nitrogen fixation protein FixH